MKKIFLLLFAVIFFLIIAEFILRFYPSHLNQWNSSLRYQPDSLIGYRMVESDNATFRMSCLEVEGIHINSLGFRGAEWKRRENSIALLGDSFAEGLQVADSELISTRLESLSNRQVMNAGMSGFGTVAGLFAYRHYVWQFHPSVVILLYYPGNDLLNNSCDLNHISGSEFISPCPCGREDENGKVKYQLPSTPAGFARSLRENFYLWRGIQNLLSGKGRERESDYSIVFQKNADEARSIASRITRKALRDLFETAREDSARLIVVNAASYYSVIPEGEEKEALRKNFSSPDAIDFLLPETEIENFCNELGIEFLNLGPVFRDYIRQHNLPSPYFYFECNGHWNNLGHELAASAINRYLSLQDEQKME